MQGLLSTRDCAPAGCAPDVPAEALTAAAQSPLFASAQSSKGGAASALMAQRYIYALDVPISTNEVARWQSSLEAVPSLMETASVEAESRFWSAEAVASLPITGGEQEACVHKLAPFPAFVARAVVSLPMTKVLRTRREWLPYRQRFPVHQVRIALLDAVLNHAVVALIGPNGTGRTLQLPLMLAETDVFKRRRTVLVVANAVAARLTVRRLREERGEDVETSRTVAFVVPTESEATEGTAVLVTTAEVLVRQLICDPLLQGVGCVIFDDVHLRNEMTELCFASVRAALLALQGASAAAAAAAVDGNEMDADSAAAAAANSARQLRVVLNCPDEACAAPLLAYFKPNGAVPFTLPASATSSSSDSVLLNVDETVAWIATCDKDGSVLCTQPEQQLAPLVENVDVVARVLAATEFDFANEAKRRHFWVPLLVESLRHYDSADRAHRAGKVALPLVVVVAPDVHTQASLEAELTHMLASSSAAAASVNEEETDAARHGPQHPFVFLPLPSADRDCAAKIRRIVAGQVVADPVAQRLVVLCTPELAQSALPFSLQIGLVLDCARVAYASTDLHTMSDLWDLEYAPIQQLRYRRAIGRLTAAVEKVDSSNGGSEAAAATAPMVLQLIPKRVLHSAQHRRQSADPTHHTLFRLPFDRYAQLYQLLQAREEAVTCQLTARDPTARHFQQQSLSSKIGALAAALFTGVPPATSNRYDTLRRTLAQVEARLVAAGHVETAVPSHDAEAVTYARLKPLGIATTCVPLPPEVTRLLCLGAALDCGREAALVAALLLVGDLFTSADGTGGAAQTDATRAALLAEARQYFSGESRSDLVVSVNVYKMWCETRAAPGSDASADENEQAFLDECGASRSSLLAVEHLHARLYLQLQQLFPLQASETGGNATTTATTAVTVTPALQQALAEVVRLLPESPLLSGPVALCLTGALYPHCAVPQTDGGAFLLETTVGNQIGTKRVGVFAATSVLADIDTASSAAGKPFVYTSKAAIAVTAPPTPASTTDTTAGGAGSAVEQGASRMVSVLSQLTPLYPAASILLCGEGTEDVRPLPRRCRGWRPALTDAWRRTRLARTLPPPSQLPTPSVTVLPYDTVRAEQVMVSTDCTFHYAMRQTTSRWLMQLRRSLQRQLTSLTTIHDVDAGDDTSRQLARQLADAWAWYERREKTGKEWLREERAILSNKASSAANSKEQNEEAEQEEVSDTEAHAREEAAAATEQQAQSNAQKLFGFFHFSTTAGKPVALTAPAAAAAAPTATERAEAQRSARPSGKANDGFTVVTGADAHRAPDVYTGRRPTADEEEIIRMCVESVAESRSRSAEAELLRDKPKVFAFLDPDNQFHEYYLYLLRQRAPDLEVLGDNLEELVEYLEALEDELRTEAGLPTREEMADAAANEEQDYQDDDADGQWGIVDPDAYDDEDGDGPMSMFETGLQMETDALNLQKPAAPTFARPSQVPPSPAAASAPGAESLLSAPPPPQSHVNTAAPAAGGGQTLMDRLMAMAQPSLMQPPSGVQATPGQGAPLFHTTPDASATAASLLPPPQQPQQQQQGQAPLPSAADLMALMDAHLPPADARVAASSTQADPSAVHQSGADGASPGTEPAAANPLALPPPPIPTKDVDERAPSIIVYPLPDRKYGNIAVILAKALGETLDVRVGPTKVVGRVARITVPNRNVELRALAQKQFTCLGEKVYILKNDRIIDNPNPHRGGHGHGILPAPTGAAGILGAPGVMPASGPIGGILGDRPPAQAAGSSWYPAPGAEVMLMTGPSMQMPQAYAPYGVPYYPSDASMPPVKHARTELREEDDDEKAQAYFQAPLAPAMLSKIGVISDDDDDDDDDSSSSVSSD